MTKVGLVISNDNKGKQALMLVNEKADVFDSVYLFCPNTLAAAIKAVMNGVALDIILTVVKVHSFVAFALQDWQHRGLTCVKLLRVW